MIWPPDLRRVRNALQRNVLLKVFSLVFAVGLWAFVNLGARDAEKTLIVPIELRNVPPELVVTSPFVDSIDVRLRGPRTILGTIDDRQLTLRLDLSKVRPGTTSFPIDPETLALPRGVRVTRLSPIDVPLSVERLVTRRVPVVLNEASIVPDGYRIAESQLRPSVVSVIGPESEIDRIEQAVTIPVELPGAATIFEDLVGVEAPSALSHVMPERVTVRARLEEIAVTREYHNVIVGVRNGSGRFETDRADVTVRGPERILNEFRPSEETVFVDLAGLGPGKHQRKIKARFPAGVEIVKSEPNALTVEIAGK